MPELGTAQPQLVYIFCPFSEVILNREGIHVGVGLIN